MEWISVKKKLPKQCEVVLTQHIDDLYPVPAYWIFGQFGSEKNKILWLRETEGPEDFLIIGRHCFLCRQPTHWKYLPPPPKEGG
jgi:hypothetical protein